MNQAPRSLSIQWVGILLVILAFTTLACLGPAVVSPTPPPPPPPPPPP